MKKNSFSIIWDWNGTIVNDAFLFVNIMNGFLSKHRLPNISMENYRDCFCFPVKKYYQKLTLNNIWDGKTKLNYIVLNVDEVYRFIKNLINSFSE